MIGKVRLRQKNVCFDVCAHNHDDHSKNFAFLYDEKAELWELAPAYDLTYNSGMRGEHATTVGGKGRDITLDDLVELGLRSGLSKANCRAVALEIQERTHSLINWAH
jgi:serine/threonine-protein kinase HipA